MENVQQAFSKLANEEGLTLEERLIARKYFAMGHAAASRWIPIEEGLPEEGKSLQINDTIGGYKPYRVFYALSGFIC